MLWIGGIEQRRREWLCIIIVLWFIVDLFVNDKALSVAFKYGYLVEDDPLNEERVLFRDLFVERDLVQIGQVASL